LQGDDDRQPLVMVQPLGMVLRLFLGAAGIGCALVSFSDLARGVWPPGWHSLLFGTILAGSLAVSAFLVSAAMFGRSVRMTLRANDLLVEKAWPFGRTRESLGAGMVASVRVVENEWDSGPSTWEIRLELRDGRSVLTPDFPTQAAASQAAARIADRLKVPG